MKRQEAVDAIKAAVVDHVQLSNYVHAIAADRAGTADWTSAQYEENESTAEYDHYHAESSAILMSLMSQATSEMVHHQDVDVKVGG